MSHFFAYLNRMKFIRRWGLMRSQVTENIQEHSLQVAMIAQALCIITNRRYGGTLQPERAAVLAMFHETAEIFTGDMPTPVKYFNQEIRSVYKQIEDAAVDNLVQTLPADLQADYVPYLTEAESDVHWVYVKAADTLAAFLKCAEEKSSGNPEFTEAYETILAKLNASDLPAVHDFLVEFAPSFEWSLDRLNRDLGER